ncbi:pentapeptide repeat-containing protein [Carboxylicivirga sp. M1479]|uniref:pentapeptide repeat-containing protein n=1 Tax=Carboxylicivirga sp. M1479 TaxID=2594476 RepID=UPI001177517E|nr:pentapeptide repeat-containing protein [Carboxylicivirga sp. M1479]TRX63996.1 pentapeptide repeat-containing protein [Carboxylicivirga sp. M1479]
MIRPYFEEQDYQGIDFTLEELSQGEYENCLFTNCKMAEICLSNHQFTDCQFINCDFSNAQITHTVFKDVRFKDCKLMGLQFNECNELFFSASFDNCQLPLASFYKRKLKNCAFINCQLHEVDFAECDLSKTKFVDCDLSNALFDNTNLSKVDMSSSYNFTIDPERNNINKAQFSNDQLIGLLGKYQLTVKQ